MPAYQLDHVQLILNFAAGVIYERAKNDHVTTVPRDKLQWIHVPLRIILVLPSGGQGSSWISAWLHHQLLHRSPAVWPPISLPGLITNLLLEGQASLVNRCSWIPVHQPGTISQTMSCQLHYLFSLSYSLSIRLLSAFLFGHSHVYGAI